MTPAMTLESYRYQDPAKVAEINEERAGRRECLALCQHHIVLWDVDVCAKRPGIAGRKLTRCVQFLEKVFHDQ